MRFISILLMVVAVIGLSLILGATAFLNFYYLIFVVLVCVAGVMAGQGIINLKNSLMAFAGCSKYGKADFVKFTVIHEIAVKYSVAAGFMGFVIGLIALFAGGNPPSIIGFGKTFSSILFGLFWGYGFHKPMADYFSKLSNEN